MIDIEEITGPLTASERAKVIGFKNLKQFREIVDMPASSAWFMNKHNPVLFQTILIGAYVTAVNNGMFDDRSEMRILLKKGTDQFNTVTDLFDSFKQRALLFKPNVEKA